MRANAKNCFQMHRTCVGRQVLPIEVDFFGQNFEHFCIFTPNVVGGFVLASLVHGTRTRPRRIRKWIRYGKYKNAIYSSFLSLSV